MSSGAAYDAVYTADDAANTADNAADTADILDISLGEIGDDQLDKFIKRYEAQEDSSGPQEIESRGPENASSGETEGEKEFDRLSDMMINGGSDAGQVFLNLLPEVQQRVLTSMEQKTKKLPQVLKNKRKSFLCHEFDETTPRTKKKTIPGFGTIFRIAHITYHIMIQLY